MDKQKFYVSVERGEISEYKAGNNDDFIIYGDPEEIIALRECLDSVQSAELDTALRANVPFREYHNDHENDLYDYYFMKSYKMIYELGDETTKRHIESMPFFQEFDKITDEQ
ncbi:hydrolase [Alkalibacillus aidingensis]|uniref:hydrolase n=1 Tax=Alkalibacillus aidingensis TaxID=2747607 RepID=UPI001661847E|nr:hydrolase [Alkalibacillus aidingensis]